MTRVTIYKNSKNECVGFQALGHAGYADEGEDIVCAAISILTINTMNAIETFTNATTSLIQDEEQAKIEFKVTNSTRETALLLNAMVLGLETVAKDKNYADYIDLKFEEVQ